MNIKKILPCLEDGNLTKLVNLIVEGKEEDVLLNEIVPYFNDQRRMHVINAFKTQFNNN